MAPSIPFRAGQYLGALAAAGLLSFAAQADAQQLRYSTTAPGGIASTGNTLGLAKAMDQNGPGTEHSIGTFITLDTNLADDDPVNDLNPWPTSTTWDWTANGSASELELPAGAQVLHAELVWAGSYMYGGEDVSLYLDDPILLSTNGAELLAQPDATTAQTLEEQSYTGFWANYYLRSADVTSFVQQHGATAYAVSGVPATQSALTNTLNGAGWSLVVAYRHDASPIRNLTVFVGGSFVDEDSVQDYTVTGFCAPPYGEVEGNVVISALEGDANLTGEDLAIGETGSSNFVSLSGPNNPENNFFCSQINDSTGKVDTSGSFGTANHDAVAGVNVPGARQGWDLTTVALSSSEGHVSNDQTSAILRTTTIGDSYYPVLMALELDVKSPDFSDSQTQASKPKVEIGDELVVTTTLANTGEAQATALRIALPLDAGLELVDFTMDGNSGDAQGSPVNAAALANGVNAGILKVGETRTIELKLDVVAPPANGNTFEFAPNWGHSFQVCSGDPAIDESFGGPEAVVTYSADTGGEGGQGGSDDPGDEGGEGPVNQVNDDPEEPASCACRATGSGSDDSSPYSNPWLALLALGAAMGLRRRR